MIENTKGGLSGHIARRIIHMCMALLPIVYYYWGDIIANWFDITPKIIVIILVSIIILAELIRLVFGVTIFGQRKHEAKQLSSFAWGALSMGLVLLLAPGPKFGIPIIWACSFGDPFVGELRRLALPNYFIFILGALFIIGIWTLCSWWFKTPYWLAWIMGPITMAAEWPNLTWIDDNATMQLVPLFLILLIFG